VTAAGEKRRWPRFALRVGGSALVLGLLFYFLPMDDLRKAVASVSLYVWPLSIGGYLAMHLLGIVKWRMTVNVAGAGLGLLPAARCYYSGLFANTFLPSIVGGDVVRAGMALRHSQSKTGLIVGSLLDRILDTMSLACVAGIGLLALPGPIDSQSRAIFLTVGVLGAAGVAVLAGLLYLVPARRFPFRARRKLVALRSSLAAVWRRPHYVLGSLLLAVVLQALLVVLNAWLGQLCGLEQPLAVWLFVWPLAKLAAMLPVSQGGIGVRELALAALFQPFGVTAVLAVASGLVFEAVVIGGGLFGGGAAFLGGRWLASGSRPTEKQGDKTAAPAAQVESCK
jgi:glycosyltransferase 2 family protein